MMRIDDDELRDIFKTASEEHLQNLDDGLLHLEKHPDDLAVLEALMRDAHSLKGDGNMLGLKEVGTLAHQIEHILSKLTQRELVLSSELSDRLAHALAALRCLVQEAVTGEPAGIDLFKVLADLMGASPEGVSASPAAATAAPLPPVPAPPLPEAAIVVQAQPPIDTAVLEVEVSCLEAHPHFLPEQPIAQHPPIVQPRLDKGNSDRSDADKPDLDKLDLDKPDADKPDLDKPDTDNSSLLSALPIDTPEPAGLPEAMKGYRIETIRVPTRNLDSLMTQAGELTVTKIRVAHRLAEIEAIANLWEEWSRDLFVNRFVFDHVQEHLPQDNSALHQLERFHGRTEDRLEQLGNVVKTLRNSLYEDTTRLEMISDELEEGIRTLRLLPLSTIFTLFPRMVRDLARQEGKLIDLVIEGGETRADKRILEEMKDPLMHILRNAIDHGMELPEERRRRGKPATGTIYLRGYQTPTSIVLEVCDDGRGLDLSKIQQTALKRGLCREEELAVMTPSQIQALIFAPGFSTCSLVTEVSGRGVGLDVVQTNVEKLKGSVQVESLPGEGTTFRIQLGLTLATAHVLIVQVSGSSYAIPVEYIRLACLVQPDEIFTLEGRDTILQEGKPLSVVRLSDLLELPTEVGRSPLPAGKPKQLACIILQSGQEQLGVFVDSLVDEQDVVLKPQSQLLKRIRNVSGATILGTGEVCIVLNPQDLIKSVRRRAVSIQRSQTPQVTPTKHTVLLVEDSIATRTQEKRILEGAGYEVVTAVDGLDGFNKLRSRLFDAIVSDVQMPNLDGLGLAAKIRQHREYNEIPIILVTSLASDEDKRRGAEAGANAYITKSSFNQEILLETLQRLI